MIETSSTNSTQFQKISIPTPRKVVGFFERRVVSAVFKQKYKAKLEFPEEWGEGGGSNQKTFCGGGMCIFWNKTILISM